LTKGRIQLQAFTKWLARGHAQQRATKCTAVKLKCLRSDCLRRAAVFRHPRVLLCVKLSNCRCPVASACYFLATLSHNAAGWNLTQWLLHVRRHNRNAAKQANCTNNLKRHKVRANWLAIVMLRNKGKCFCVSVCGPVARRL
jgi:hypothetical protein